MNSIALGVHPLDPVGAVGAVKNLSALITGSHLVDSALLPSKRKHGVDHGTSGEDVSRQLRPRKKGLFTVFPGTGASPENAIRTHVLEQMQTHFMPAVKEIEEFIDDGRTKKKHKGTAPKLRQGGTSVGALKVAIGIHEKAMAEHEMAKRARAAEVNINQQCVRAAGTFYS